MNLIQFECPHCHEIINGNESWCGQQVKCEKCQTMMLVPPMTVGAAPLTARLIQAPLSSAIAAPIASSQEADIFTVSPVARSFAGQISLGVILVGLGIVVAFQAQDYSWPMWVALIPVAVGVLLWLVVGMRVKSCSYRLTTQRLFVRRGFMSRRQNELELYRVKDVVVDQGILQRLLGYGTITVMSDDDTTPTVNLVGVSSPTKVKETIRTQYRAARQREGVRPTELMKSP